MAKIKLTKGELKRQRDALKQYYRYLPTLHLKKKQLQLEIHRYAAVIRDKRAQEETRLGEARAWAGLLSDTSVDLRQWVVPSRVATASRNVAGVDIPVYEEAFFGEVEYDLFLTPPWVDYALEELRGIVSLREELSVLDRALAALKAELRTTSQRVNLFEKVKIPQAEDAIRRIKISIGDQMTNAVGRSKIAKQKIEMTLAAEAFV